ncbi:MAG: aminoacyltransferase [Chloroflexota bacterium]|nr:aminoacyltransferase [Chloroflexota bacterium]
MEVLDQPDRRSWDGLLRRLGGHPLQAHAWGALKERFGWRAHRLVTASGTAAAQVLIRPHRGLAVAYVPCGPLLSGDTPTDAALVDAIMKLARSRRAAFVRLEPDVLEDDPGAPALLDMLRTKRFRTTERTLQPRSSIRLDLTRSPDQLLAGFSKGHRADVRRAEREGVQIKIGTTDGDVDALHGVMVATKRRKSFAIHSAAYYRSLWQLFGDDARLLMAEHNGQVVAASLIVAFGDRALYLAAGSTEAGMARRASHLLQWHAIRWAREKGARSYDLWGIPDARGRLALAERAGSSNAALADALESEAQRDPLDGVYRFKKGWGGQVVRSVPALDRVFLPPAYWFWRWRRGEA